MQGGRATARLVAGRALRGTAVLSTALFVTALFGPVSLGGQFPGATAVPALGLASSSSPAPGTPAYMARDAQNMVNAFGRELGPGGEFTSTTYWQALIPALLTTEADQLSAQASEPTRPALTGGNLVPGWNTGNPLRQGWAGTRGRVVPVQFTASHSGALLVGDLFAPSSGAHDPYSGKLLPSTMPGVVIVTGSIQASSGLYTWLAEDLAERGYLVLTFDVQGQGRSETLPHQGPVAGLPGCSTTTSPGEATPCAGFPSEQQQSFDYDAEDAISFFLSTPLHPYPNVAAGTTPVNSYNPLYSLFDRSPDPATVTPGRSTRLALIGHSTGAVAVSYLQGVDSRIATAVALDKITATPNAISDDEALLGAPGPVVPTVPILGVQSEYGFEPQPYWEASCSSFEPCPAAPGGSVTVPNLSKAPDPNREEATGFNTWVAHHVDSMVVVPRASTHLDYTDEPPVLPASQWGQAMASFYIQAWLAKYLGHDPAADAELTSTAPFTYLTPVGGGVWAPVTIDRRADLSFYFCSGYSLHSAGGGVLADSDLVGDGCS
ncbi:MAG TPA: hypothetical protein VMV14_06185 [Acidimicrobiales bacterium]|nr:hypothetical protein [Acidimicrobiales bacterium]